MLKKYVANNRSKLTLIVSLPEGGQTTIEFRKGYGNEAYHLTNVEEMQNILENDPRFGESYRLEEIDNVFIKTYEARQLLLDKKTEEKPVDPPASPDGTKVDPPACIEFKNINEIRDYLMGEPYNVESKKIPNLKAVENKAKELGIVFKILNTK